MRKPGTHTWGALQPVTRSLPVEPLPRPAGPQGPAQDSSPGRSRPLPALISGQSITHQPQGMGLTRASSTQRCRHAEPVSPQWSAPVYALWPTSRGIHLGIKLPPSVLPQLLLELSIRTLRTHTRMRMSETVERLIYQERWEGGSEAAELAPRRPGQSTGKWDSEPESSSSAQCRVNTVLTS